MDNYTVTETFTATGKTSREKVTVEQRYHGGAGRSNQKFTYFVRYHGGETTGEISSEIFHDCFTRDQKKVKLPLS